jgi:hypothetical protein
MDTKLGSVQLKDVKRGGKGEEEEKTHLVTDHACIARLSGPRAFHVSFVSV